MKKQTSLLILGVILLISLILNLWGISYGLPQKYFPDEGRIVNHALAFGLGDFNPHYFNYPGLSMYLLFILYGGYYALGSLSGLFASSSEFQRLFFRDPTSFYLIGRVGVALTGVAIVGFTYRLGYRAFRNRRAALIGAGFLASLPYFTYYSHFIVTDILQMLFIVLAFIFIIKISRGGSFSDYLMAGIFTGLGIATKYSPALIAAPILLAHLYGCRSRKISLLSRSPIFQLLICFGAILIFFFIGSPYCFLDYQSFFASLQFRSHLGSEHTFGTGSGTAWLLYPQLLFIHPFLLFNRIDPMGFIIIGGLLWALFKRTREDIIFFIFPLLLYLMMGGWSFASNRYLLPLMPFFCLWGGRVVSEIISLSTGRRRGFSFLTTSLIILVIGLNLANSLLNDFRLTCKDTRFQAKEWIEENISPGTRIALEWDTEATVQLWETPEDIAIKIRDYESGKAATIHHSSKQMAEVHRMRLASVPKNNYRIIRLGGMDGTRIKEEQYSLEGLRKQGARYLITSSEVSRIFFSEKGKKLYPIQNSFYRESSEELGLKKSFTPSRLGSLGPVIKIYKFP
jgi:4-amino-4-deoxy-L-arabinose transferase-like glycosyltransferase